MEAILTKHDLRLQFVYDYFVVLVINNAEKFRRWYLNFKKRKNTTSYSPTKARNALSHRHKVC